MGFPYRGKSLAPEGWPRAQAMFRLRTLVITSSACFAAGGWLGSFRKYVNSLNATESAESPFNFTDVLPVVSASSAPDTAVISAEATEAVGTQSTKHAIGTNVSPSFRVGEIMKFGFPGLDNIRNQNEFVISYDRRTRNAKWVFEHLTPERLIRSDHCKVDRNKCRFMEDQSIHLYFRASNEDYKKSGYDRGHLAAAGNYRASQASTDQTFLLSNIAPQVGKGFNRDAWNSLERLVRAIARRNKNVYVCTGPLYLPQRENNKLFVKYEVIGKNNIAVPTHFFKVIVIETNGGEFEQLSFVMPNTELPSDVPLKNYLVPMETIERAAGLLLFQKLPKQRLKSVNKLK